MRYILLIALLLSFIVPFAQKKDSLKSADGKLELIFPSLTLEHWKSAANGDNWYEMKLIKL